MAIRGHLDEASEFAIHGWAFNEDAPAESVHVEIVIAGAVVATVPANLYRPDLLEAGFHNGHKAFWFNPFDLWTRPSNDVQVRAAGELLINGSRTVHALSPVRKHALWQRKRLVEEHWRAAQPGPELTRGEWLTGDAFLDQVERFYRFREDTGILELGPGYGSLVGTLAARDKQFERYLGVDLSRACTNALRAQFRTPRMRFFAGTGDTYPYPELYDLVLASATCHLIFPSIGPCLAHVAQCMHPGGMMFADFTSEDGGLAASHAFFENQGRAFHRVYSERELRSLYARAGLDVIEIVHPFMLGTARRALVIAEKSFDSM